MDASYHPPSIETNCLSSNGWLLAGERQLLCLEGCIRAAERHL